MPLYEYTFTDTTTIQVNATNDAAGKAHVEHLIAESKFVDNGYKGKALASTAGRVVDKWKEREALNKAARG
ncbi:MAG TPA: hypothetical protein VFE84_05005 [Patescibacteria group bacterium]|jgi:hypothetical protein|nr:hypothetical protein [Patescibacteria group bacterium]